MEYPFAYLNGKHCCKTNNERPKGAGAPQDKIDNGSCDGLNFGRQSSCCENNDHVPCLDLFQNLFGIFGIFDKKFGMKSWCDDNPEAYGNYQAC